MAAKHWTAPPHQSSRLEHAQRTAVLLGLMRDAVLELKGKLPDGAKVRAMAQYHEADRSISEVKHFSAGEVADLQRIRRTAEALGMNLPDAEAERLRLRFQLALGAAYDAAKALTAARAIAVGQQKKKADASNKAFFIDAIGQLDIVAAEMHFWRNHAIITGLLEAGDCPLMSDREQSLC